VKAGVPGAALPALRPRRVKATGPLREIPDEPIPARSDVATDNPIPTPPFWGDRLVKGIRLAEYAPYLDERALFLGQWGLKPGRGAGGRTYEELVEEEGRPRLRMWLERLQTENLLEAAVVYGYFPAVSKGDSLLILDDADPQASRHERMSFTFPRQRRDRHLCLADFWRPEDSGVADVAPFQLVTVGARIAEATAELFAANSYREYMELHGLSVQLAEALAEYWHARVREELGFADEDPTSVDGLFKVEYRGCRYSFGYPACPDLEDRSKIVELLKPERIGVRLSEEFQLHPEQSTDAIVAHHPEASYFNAG
jgi:5-methyltetrahydrofolate--homocysteine methyltransferase